MKIGDVHETKDGPIEIVEYEGWNSVFIRFQNTGYEINVSAQSVRNGTIKDRLRKSLAGVGYLGIGPWTVTVDGKISRVYRVWQGLITRCYAESSKDKWPTYIGCSVAYEWHNFQTFADWYSQLKYKGDDWDLDKDVLDPGNKIYSSETCVLIPTAINRTMRAFGCGDLPVGVAYIGSGKRNKRYQAQIAMNGLNAKSLGYYATPEEAGEAYKKAREQYIRRLATEWDGLVDPRVIKAMSQYSMSTR